MLFCWNTSLDRKKWILIAEYKTNTMGFYTYISEDK